MQHICTGEIFDIYRRSKFTPIWNLYMLSDIMTLILPPTNIQKVNYRSLYYNRRNIGVVFGEKTGWRIAIYNKCEIYDGVSSGSAIFLNA